MRVDLVPIPIDQTTVYQVLDELRTQGRVWCEMAEAEANEPNIIEYIAEGRFNHPARVIAFNTEEGWPRDVTKDIALKLLDLSMEGWVLGAAAREFVERETGQTATGYRLNPLRRVIDAISIWQRRLSANLKNQSWPGFLLRHCH
jgi:hypothetical protein